ncbi:MAG TPA: FHA domain-containing protein [Ktedonobacterales bacterium]|jgi:pSer/pThr/pTyr-binding forkhead associated (FHA) protein|nr:FHA domain-containing protein [Ktedonobacterales bacterium]
MNLSDLINGGGPFGFLFILRIALVVILYLVILQIVGVARRDLRRAAAVAQIPGQARQVVGHLIVIDSGTTKIPLNSRMDIEPITTIGRAPTSSVVIDSGVVSTDHARITYRNRSLWVEDLGSHNGTYINGRKITGPTAVKPDDILQVGDVRFKFTV